MTTTALGVGMPTLLDFVKAKDPDGSIARMVPLMSQKVPILDHIPWQEGNLDTGHRVTSEVALPSISWRRINGGVAPSKGLSSQKDETCGMMDAISKIDAEIVRINGGVAYRDQRDASFLAAMAHELSTSLFYASQVTAEEEITGLAPRFASTTATGGGQITLADATASSSDQTSLWGIVWGESVYGIVPKGTKSGIEVEDLGKDLIDAPDSTETAPKEFVAYRTHFVWRCGFCVEDFRQIVRVANIDTSALTADASAGADIVESAIKAYHNLREPMAGRLVWYCNKTVGTYLHLQARAATLGGSITTENVGGKPVTMLCGAPVFETDSITSAEAVIS